MCGIVGFLGGADVGHVRDFETQLRQMSDAIKHRGPDDEGRWWDVESGVGLGHRRLSILDLSPAGHQPMESSCGRFVIVFNGEIYNHLDLRAQLGLRAPAWRGHSDTETLLACFTAWGVEETLKATAGMFAIALWDKQTRKLVLARDRMGEKPLYFGYVGGMFAFASEVKVLRLLPGFRGQINRGALSLLLRHNAVPAPYCIYEDLAKLRPGTWLEISSDLVRRRDLPVVQTYWSAFESAIAGVGNQLVFASEEDAESALEAELSRAVAGQMISDVPLGAFLSGGVDSSIVVALMQKQSRPPIKTFSIGFREAGYDEAKFAGDVARHLGTEHTELYVSPDDALAVIPRLPSIYCEPFSDSSQIPTFLVAQLARQRVTVALSGDGGDELFGGYTRYFLAAQLWGRISSLPAAARKALAKLILALPVHVLNRLFDLASPIIPPAYRWPALGDKLHKGASLLKSGNGIDLYRGLVSHWEPSELMAHVIEPDTLLVKEAPGLPTLVDQMMAIDALTYLPDDILVKVDRAAMAVSLETRVPLIDHRVFEFAWRLPLHYKVRNDTGKWLLRQVLYRHVPRNLIDRPKMGFGVPIDSWLRGPLREWAEELLDEGRLKQEGFFNPTPIRHKWLEHLSGKRNWQYHLWDVLMFQAWLEEQRK